MVHDHVTDIWTSVVTSHGHGGTHTHKWKEMIKKLHSKT